MNFKTTNKKGVVFLVIIILVLAIGGFFWWWENREIKGSPKDYIIKETPEGKIVENKKAGLKMEAPDGWKIEKVNFNEGAIAFNSPDLRYSTKEGRIFLPLKEGCRIQSSLGYEKMSFDDIKTSLKYSYSLMGMKFVRFKRITVNKYLALQSIFDKKTEGKGIGMSISIPVKNKVYGFSITWGHNDKEKCIQGFNKFLATILIK
jgi:hypothetical protein